MEKTAICKNPWCKAPFEYKDEAKPNECPKCKSFNSDLSGGVSWMEKKYEGSRFDGMPHNISIDIKKYTR